LSFLNPIGILKKEHRLIERMLLLLEGELELIYKGEKANPDLIKGAVNFFTTYTDLTHHGKEENILFRDLEKKELSPNASSALFELTKAHDYARKIVADLNDANTRYAEGELELIGEIQRNMSHLIIFYPPHIEQEDETFFTPVMSYFSDEEQAGMVKEFWDYDRKLIDDGYKKIVDDVSLHFDELTRWVCTICGYSYDPKKSTAANVLNMPYQELPPDFLCSVCFAPNESFERRFTI